MRVKESLHGCGYTSARLKTRRRDGTPLFTKLYGTLRVPRQGALGQGAVAGAVDAAAGRPYGGWAASGEIDLMEIVGEKPHEVLNSIHFGSAYPSVR